MTMLGIQGDVEAFMREVARQDLPEYPTTPDTNTIQLRASLITEEIDETLHALNLLTMSDKKSKLEEISLWAELADGIVDSIVVLVGTASAFGIDLENVWERVHRSNMAKADGPIREDGKRLKPEGWQAPNILAEIREQVAEHDFADKKIG